MKKRSPLAYGRLRAALALVACLLTAVEVRNQTRPETVNDGYAGHRIDGVSASVLTDVSGIFKSQRISEGRNGRAWVPTGQQSIDGIIERDIPTLLSIYKSLHANPELSHHEEKTSALVANELRSLGYAVTERVGKYALPGSGGYGVVAVMRSGSGPTLLVRADMDALPVEEKTGLPYASKVVMKNNAGQDVPVMHACGHDIHVATLLGTARALAQLKGRWSGTLMLVAQPAEETLDGAKAMLADGLYERFPKPDYALALHDNAELEAGKVGYTPGYFLASADKVDITVRGVGGHGAWPDRAKDPVVLASQIVLALQTIISRENSPLDPAVVTVGSIHGGTRENIIPDEVTLQVSVRAYKEEVRQRMLNSIERITKGVALAAGVPPGREPVVKRSETVTTPSTHNDTALTERLAGVFQRALGADSVVKMAPIMGSEDFGHYGLKGLQIPTFMFWLGAVDPTNMAESKRTGQPLPALHSSGFAPSPELTIRTGVKAMTSAALDLLKP